MDNTSYREEEYMSNFTKWCFSSVDAILKKIDWYNNSHKEGREEVSETNYLNHLSTLIDLDNYYTADEDYFIEWRDFIGEVESKTSLYVLRILNSFLNRTERMPYFDAEEFSDFLYLTEEEYITALLDLHWCGAIHLSDEALNDTQNYLN